MNEMQDFKKRYFSESSFTGNYEKENSLLGMIQEQWLWKYREYIRGITLDMSTPRHWHEFVYQIASKVLISDLQGEKVEKMGRESLTDIVHDFCKPYWGRKFDTILCSGILEHCENPFSMTTVLSNALVPGGYLFIYTPYAYMDGHMDPDYWRFCRRGYIKLLETAGLVEVSYDRYIEIQETFKTTINIDMSGVYVAHGIVAVRK
jgi:hypothetical protein